MKTPPATLATALLLAGCQSQPPYPVDSPHYAYPRGLAIHLVQALEIPPGAATVRLQYGRPVARNGVQEVDPHCIFELDTVGDAVQRVAPDSFSVTRIQRREQTFSGMPAWPQPWPRSLRVGWDDDGPSHLYYLTEFRLHSPRQPAVRSLTCQSNQMSAGIAIMRHLSLPEMRGALGDYFRLELPD